MKRGKWILEQILGTPPPPPPPNVPELKEDKDVVLAGTLRQRMEQHRANPDCAACHAGWTRSASASRTSMRSAPGATRTGASPIDASGTLPAGERSRGRRRAEGDPQGARSDFARCLAEKLLTYALGRGLDYYDQCAVDKIVDATRAATTTGFRGSCSEIVNSDPFQKRRAESIRPGRA